MALVNNKDNLSRVHDSVYKIDTKYVDEQFCPHCGAIRKCELTSITYNSQYVYTTENIFTFYNDLPYVYGTRCLQCDHKAISVIYEVEKEIKMAVLHDTYSGCITPNTPSELNTILTRRSECGL